MIKIKLLLASLLGFAGLYAQSYIPVTNEYFAFSTGEKEVFKTTFNQVSLAEAEGAFKDYLKNYKSKIEPVKGISNEYQIAEVLLSDINQAKTAMFVKFTELEGNASIYIHYLNNGKIVSKGNTPNEFDGYTKFTEAIADKSVFSAFESLIKTQSIKVKAKEKELNSIEKDEVKEHDAIGKAKKSIKDSKVMISTLEGQYKNQQSMLASKQKQVGDKQSEIASVDIKTLDGQINDLEKENKSFVKDLEKAREESAKISGEKAVLNVTLETQNKAIKAQKDLLAVTGDKKAMKEVQSMEKDAAILIGEIEEKKGEIAIEAAAARTAQEKIDAYNIQIVSIQKKIASHSENALKDQLKLLEKDLKDLENEADKIVKDTSKENDNVTKEEEGIRQSEAEIQRLKEAQSMKKSEISEATEVLNDLASEQAKFK